jgi:hypothetical protein
MPMCIYIYIYVNSHISSTLMFSVVDEVRNRSYQIRSVRIYIYIHTYTMLTCHEGMLNMNMHVCMHTHTHAWAGRHNVHSHGSGKQECGVSEVFGESWRERAGAEA